MGINVLASLVAILRMRSSVALPAASEGQFIGGCDVDAN